MCQWRDPEVYPLRRTDLRSGIRFGRAPRLRPLEADSRDRARVVRLPVPRGVLHRETSQSLVVRGLRTRPPLRSANLSISSPGSVRIIARAIPAPGSVSGTAVTVEKPRDQSALLSSALSYM